MEKQGSAPIAGLVPGLQGMPVRLSHARGYGDVQSGVSITLLRGPFAPAPRLFHGPDPRMGRHRVENTTTGEPCRLSATKQEPRQMAGRNSTETVNASVCPANVPRLVEQT